MIDCHAVRPGTVFARWDLQWHVISLAVAQTAVRLNAERPQVRLIAVRHHQCAFSRPENNAIGTKPLGHNLLLPISRYVPDALPFRVGEPDLASRRDRQVIAVVDLHDRLDGTVRLPGGDSFAVAAASVEFSTGAEHQPTGAFCVFRKQGHSAVGCRTIDTAVGWIGKEDVSLWIDRRPLRELVAFSDKLPRLIVDQNLRERHVLRMRRCSDEQNNECHEGDSAVTAHQPVSLCTGAIGGSTTGHFCLRSGTTSMIRSPTLPRASLICFSSPLTMASNSATSRALFPCSCRRNPNRYVMFCGRQR